MELYTLLKSFNSGRDVIAARSRKRMNQTELAKLMGCSRAKISQIENTDNLDSIMKVEMMKKLSSILLDDEV